MGFTHCKVGHEKKMGWNMGLVPPRRNYPLSMGVITMNVTTVVSLPTMYDNYCRQYVPGLFWFHL